MGLMDSLQLKLVIDEDISFLYELLKERDETININHKKLPTYEEHSNFVKSNKYDGWYIILLNSKKVGHIWINSESYIGTFIKKEYQKIGLGVISFKKLRELHKRKKYLGRVNPNNIQSKILLEKFDFKLKKSYNDHLEYEYSS